MEKQKKKARHSKHPHNRQYKDRLWRMIFNNKEDLLQLYNAINHTDYQNPDNLEVNTLEDVLLIPDCYVLCTLVILKSIRNPLIFL